MNSLQILQPAAVLALFTVTVLLLIPIRTAKALLAKQIKVNDLKPGVSAIALAEVSIPNRNYMNLLELPVIFYVASLLIFVINKVDTTFLYLAWAYVVLRIIHSAIHLSYNHVLHRGLVFAVSNGVLTVIWVRILLALW